MALDFVHNIPTVAENDVDLKSFVRTNIVHVQTTDTTGKGTSTRTTVYTVASGDKSLPTQISVRCTKREPGTEEPLGSSSYAIRVETLMNIVDGALTLVSGAPAAFTLSWNLPGGSIYTEQDVMDCLQALFSLIWPSVAAGTPSLANLTNLAYANTRILG